MDLIGYLPQFGNLAWTVLAFITALSIIIAIHEYGHYIIGRLCGIHAEVFSLGFGPVLLSRRDRRGTLWQIAALPLGGYVKFLGDADAASTRAIEVEGINPRRTLPGAPLWARAATVAAGPAFNFVFAIIVFAGVVMVQGMPVDRPIIGSVRALPQGDGGLQAGDRLIRIGDTPVATWADVSAAAEQSETPTVPYEIERNGQTLSVQGPNPFPPVVASVAPRSAALEAGLREGDVIAHVNGTPISTFTDLRDIVGAADGGEVTLDIWRAGQNLDRTLSPKRQDIPLPSGGFETRWLIGVTGDLVFVPESRRAGGIEAVGIAANQTWTIVTTSLSGMWHMVTGAISTCNLQGPIGIAETSGAAASAGAQNFIWFIAVLSVAVGLMNLFPIPVLDGGHLVFYAIEAVLGRPPGPRFMNAMMTGGLALVLGLMVFALTNDIFCP
ncbi:RIP metalloprotease RseP [Falsirhodobacter halotolerans]|uniref:RIP metalloprotease RseP n=1 Tax=Falsirhodobacter halotolerans TaxID=1146892 RepID=UPI001FD4DD32|nr:RIP metalloprotease RseP [Falsirhodobacter halotolerans]MCJ8139646.1 RIP metalloprotease RseP [Falsirhodobacter halotolerans]